VPADARYGPNVPKRPNGRGPAPGRRPRRRTGLPRGLRLGARALAGSLALIVLAAAGTGFYMDRTLLRTLTTSNALDGLGGRTEADQNILLMGLDSRKDINGDDLPAAVLDQLHAGSSSDIGGYNTNTLILLHVPADGSRATALSIPRDDYVNLPEGLGEHKIKEAYGRAKALAEQKAQQAGTTGASALEQLGREAGRRASIEAVQNLLGVQVDHFAEINLAGFYDLADALGGVTVCLREPARDDYSGADFPAGVQTLDGAQALAFVRQRHNLAGGDLDRTHRQQAFLASAAAKLNSAGVFGDLGRLDALLDVAHRDVVVDSGFDPLSFIRQAGALTSGDVSFYTLPIKGFATEGGESVNLVDPAQVRAVTRELLSGKSADGTADGGRGPQIPQVSVEPNALAQAGDERAAPQGRPVATKAADARPATSASGPAAAGRTAAKSRTAAAAASPAAPVNLDPPPGVPCVD
jgi:LCP family protein required for cell wall assembly